MLEKATRILPFKMDFPACYAWRLHCYSIGWWKAEATWLGAVGLLGNPLNVNYQGRFSPGMAAQDQ